MRSAQRAPLLDGARTLIAGLLVSAGASAQAQEPPPYPGDAAEIVAAPNGALVNKKVLGGLSVWAMSMPPAPLKVAEGVWQMVGHSLNAPVVIEGDDGLIVWDTGESVDEGKRLLADIRKLSAKPIKAIVYSHSHYVNGTSAVAPSADTMVIGHPALNANRQTSGAGSYFPELTPIQIARALEQFHTLLPKEGPDAPVVGAIYPAASPFVPVNRPVQDGEIVTVAGVRMQFFTRYGSDTDDTINVWLPDRKVALTNHYWPMPPNIYTPRGAKFRDPREWVEGLKVVRALQPEVLLNTHGRPVLGRERIQQELTLYLDGTQLLLDQTLRGTLLGLGPDELRSFVRLPPQLAAYPNFAESYGEIGWYAPYIYQHALGWFTGDAASLSPLPPQVEAKKIVDGFGGRDAVLRQARQALDRREYAWAVQLATYLYRLNPQDRDARLVKAEGLRKMGQASTATLARSIYLTQARALEGSGALPILVLPTVAQMQAVDPGLYVDFQRVRLDPAKSGATDAMLRIEFSDLGRKAYALHVRRGVAEFVADPNAYPRKPDQVLRLDRATWARLYRGEIDVGQAIASGSAQVEGDPRAVERFFALFDRFDPRRNLLIPPLASGQ
jgi:alkyl sulfatase BDS1-like metallo-beta-lactamase superfamily hydrolase